LKIAVIGGGSTYTPELIDGILRRQDRLPITEIHLVDINRERLQVIAAFAARMVKAAGSSIVIDSGTDLRTAISGSTYVVSQFRVGTQTARHNDEMLGRRFGLIGQETVGVGGFAKALRTIPIALSIAQVVAEVAPTAILLNFTNPAGLITQMLKTHAPAVNSIGLCNVPWNTKVELATALEIPTAELSLDYVGLNHLSWVRGVSHRGEDISLQALAAFRNLAINQANAGESPSWLQSDVDIFQAIPNYYLLYYFAQKPWIEYQNSHPTRASEVMKIEIELMEKFSDESLVTKPAELMQRGGAYYSDAAAELMADIYQDAGTIHIVNTLNNGAIPGIPDDAVVEISATISRSGAKAIGTANLAPEMHSLITTVKDFELLTIDAAITGNERSATLALLTNPLGPDISEVNDVWKLIRKENQGMIGLFNE
jgi:6-phospho-beta-glucosidase